MEVSSEIADGWEFQLATGPRTFEEVTNHEAAHLAARLLKGASVPARIEVMKVGAGYAGSIDAYEVSTESTIAPSVLEIGYHLSKVDLQNAQDLQLPHNQAADWAAKPVSTISSAVDWLQERRDAIRQLASDVASVMIPGLDYACYHFSVGGGKWIFEGAHDEKMLVVRGG